MTHVGKLYNIVAQQITDSLVQELDEIEEAYCYLVSQIGSPINEPKIVDLRLQHSTSWNFLSKPRQDLYSCQWSLPS